MFLKHTTASVKKGYVHMLFMCNKMRYNKEGSIFPYIFSCLFYHLCNKIIFLKYVSFSIIITTYLQYLQPDIKCHTSKYHIIMYH
jgi:general stress protein CsbA